MELLGRVWDDAGAAAGRQVGGQAELCRWRSRQQTGRRHGQARTNTMAVEVPMPLLVEIAGVLSTAPAGLIGWFQLFLKSLKHRGHVTGCKTFIRV